MFYRRVIHPPRRHAFQTIAQKESESPSVAASVHFGSRSARARVMMGGVPAGTRCRAQLFSLGLTLAQRASSRSALRASEGIARVGLPGRTIGHFSQTLFAKSKNLRKALLSLIRGDSQFNFRAIDFLLDIPISNMF